MNGTKADLFPSEFFVADELDANWRERMTLSGWAMRPMFDEAKQQMVQKPVLLFTGRKPMPLNVTNFESLEKLTKKHSAAEFAGFAVTFYRTTDRRNKKPCIRIDETEPAEFTKGIATTAPVAPTPAPSPRDPVPEMNLKQGGVPIPSTQQANARRHPLLSPVQRNKLTELYRLLCGGDDAAVLAGLDQKFGDGFKVSMNEATYEQGARMTGELLQELRRKTN